MFSAGSVDRDFGVFPSCPKAKSNDEVLVWLCFIHFPPTVFARIFRSLTDAGQTIQNGENLNTRSCKKSFFTKIVEKLVFVPLVAHFQNAFVIRAVDA